MGLEAAGLRGAGGGGGGACQRAALAEESCIFCASQEFLLNKFAEANPPGLPGPAHPTPTPTPPRRTEFRGSAAPERAPQGRKGQRCSEPQGAPERAPLLWCLGTSAWVGEQVVDSANPAPPHPHPHFFAGALMLAKAGMRSKPRTWTVSKATTPQHHMHWQASWEESKLQHRVWAGLAKRIK